MSFRIIEGDCLARLADIPDRSVQTCVTSPPYWGLRDYGAEGQLGLEPTPEHYVENMVAVFREVRRVLRDDGTLWLNLGDSYANLGHYKGNPGDVGNIGKPQVADVEGSKAYRKASNADFAAAGLKNKDLVGIPWMVAFALRADGWYLRSDIIWAKTNPMPESVTDRPTRAHEQIFLLTKQRRYSYDADAIREPATYEGPNGTQLSPYAQGFGRRTPEQEAERRVKRRTVRPGIDTNRRRAGNGAMSYPAHSRNKRSVWTVATQPFPGAHFAVMPTGPAVGVAVKFGSRPAGGFV